MISPRSVLVWVAASGLSLAGLFATPGAVRDRTPALASPPARSAPVVERAAPSDAEAITTAAPFRAARTVPAMTYRAGVTGEAVASPPEQPAWILTGVLDGTPRVAVLEGGGATYVLAAGDEVGSYRVTDVAEDAVIIESGGASWTITLEAPWGR